MSITKVSADHNRTLQDIADSLASAKKIVMVVGAGISTSCGIPDFRSSGGLFSRKVKDPGASSTLRAKSQSGSVVRSGENVQTPPMNPDPLELQKDTTTQNGKDMFDANVFRDEASTAAFYTFLATMRDSIQQEVQQTSASHRFIRTLRDRRKLVRCYSQNIDGLEKREGLEVDIAQGKGSTTRFSRKALSLAGNSRMPACGRGASDNAGCEVVQLHGSLESLRCTICQLRCRWTTDEHDRIFMTGQAPLCSNCQSVDLARRMSGKRGTRVGNLRPNIVLYGEEHPDAEMIGQISAHDLRLAPDMLLILGTSMHVHGLKVLVREFAKTVHDRHGNRKAGKVVFVNRTAPSQSAWKDLIDYWVCMDCDDWVRGLRQRRPDIWQHQGVIQCQTTKVKSAKNDKVHKGNTFVDMTSSGESDKENGATFMGTETVAKAEVFITTPRREEKRAYPATSLLSPSDDAPLSGKPLLAAMQSDLTDSVYNSFLPTPPPTCDRIYTTGSIRQTPTKCKYSNIRSKRPDSDEEEQTQTPTKRIKLVEVSRV